MKRVLKWLIRLTVLTPLLGLPAAFWWLTGTTAGAQWLFAEIASQLNKDLEIGGVSGTLGGNLTLTDVSFADGVVEFTSRRVGTRWDVSGLLAGAVHLPYVELSGVDYRSDDAAQNREDSPFSLPRLPLTLRIDELRIDSAQALLGTQRLHLDHLLAGISTADQRLSVDIRDMSGMNTRMKGSLGAALISPFAFDASLDWHAAPQPDQAWAGNLRAEGNTKRVGIRHRLTAPVSVTTQGSIDLAGSSPTVDLKGEWTDLTWPPGEQAQWSSPSGRFSLSGAPAALVVQLKGNLHQRGRPVLESAQLEAKGAIAPETPQKFVSTFAWSANAPDLQLAGDGSLNGDVERISLKHNLTMPFALQTHGSILLAESRINLAGEWRKLVWPISGEPVVRSDSGRFRIQGTPLAYEADIDGPMLVRDLPPAVVKATLRGDDEHVDFESVTVQALDGSTRLSGRLTLEPGPTLDLKVEAHGLKPRQLFPELAGQIDVQAALKASANDGRVMGKLHIKQLKGVMSGQDLAGHAIFNFRDNHISAEQLQLISGANRLKLKGRMDQPMDMAFSVAAPDLARLWPGLNGRLKGTGRAAGAWPNPTIVAQLRAEGLVLGSLRAAELTLDVNLDPNDVKASGANVRGREISVDDYRVKDLTLAAQGNLRRHKAVLEAVTDLGELTLSAAGGTGEQGWIGAVDKARIHSQTVGNWRLKEAVKITTDSRRWSSSKGCWESDAGRLCHKVLWGGDGDARIDAQLSDFDVARLKKWLPENTGLRGKLHAQAELSGKASGLTGEGRIRLTGGMLEIAEIEGRDAVRIPLHDLKSDLELMKDGLTANWRIRLGPDGKSAGSIRLAAVSEGASSPISGRVTASIPDIGPIAALLPQLAASKGAISGELTVTGTAAQPRLSGDATLTGQATVPDLNLELKDIRLRAHSDGGEDLSYDGALVSGGGQLRLTGKTRLDASASWPTRLAIKGTGFAIARLPETYALVTPDLDIRIKGPKVEIRGAVLIPEASVTLKDVPQGAVSVSTDQRIVDENNEPVQAEQRAGGIAINADLDVTLGEKVIFDGLGLTTRVSGKLHLKAEPQQVAQAHGDLNLLDGRYRAYGQDLTIERGLFVFNGPVDNPAVDVRAVRRAGDVKAGLRIGGSVRKLRTSVFSEPAMPQAEALSYLLTGRKLGGDGGPSRAMLAGAAVGLGLEQAQGITQSLGGRVGLDEVGVKSGSTLQQSSLLLGKYLSPDLYVRYALGLLDPIGSVQLEYQLSPAISVEAETSQKSQAVDLIYRLESD